jgi:adenine/guanine phosphoribosyltransferase-like PRPP-binding protein
VIKFIRVNHVAPHAGVLKPEVRPSTDDEQAKKYLALVNDLGGHVSRIEGVLLDLAPVGNVNDGEVLNKAISLTKGISGHNDVLIVDISNYIDGDRFLAEIADTLINIPLYKKNTTVVILTSIESFSQLDIVKRHKKNLHACPGELIIVDMRGMARKVSNKQQSYDIQKYIKSLEITNEDDFRKLALRKCKKSYGHFVLSEGAHVRTHDKKGFNYLLRRVRTIKEKTEFQYLLGFGLGTTALQDLIMALSSELKIKGDIIEHDTEPRIYDNIQRAWKRVMLITDLINTGDSLKRYVEELEVQGASVVGCFSVLGLHNSASKLEEKNILIEYGATLKRSYYEGESRCDLCNAHYPRTNVTSEKEFYPDTSINPLPYDFWELVHECNALEIGHQVGKGDNHYHMYINTEKILAKYGSWIAYVLYKQLKNKLQRDESLKDVNYLVMPDEKAAGILSTKIQAIVRNNQLRVIALSQEDYISTVPYGISPDLRKNYRYLEKARVLIIDDGINTHKTFTGIVNLLNSLEAKIQGFAVFLNRLPIEEYGKDYISFQDIKIPFYYFYHWPNPPYHYNFCYCRKRGHN